MSAPLSVPPPTPTLPASTPSSIAPAIYQGQFRSEPLTLGIRLVALVVAGGALAVLITAAWLSPDARGFGTHEALGLQPCGFLMRTGYPCAGCGMTTSFSDAVRGRLISAFIAQPFGLLLCIMSAMAFWGGLYVAATGRAAYRLVRLVPNRAHVILWPTLALAGWAWKIAMTWHGT